MNTNKVRVLVDIIENALADPTTLWYEPLGWAETRTGIRRFKLLTSLVFFVTTYLVAGYKPAVFSNTIAFAFPAYQTIKLMGEPQLPANPGTVVIQNAARWMTYWMIFAVVMMAESQLAFVLEMVPVYHLVRTAFFVWCFLPIPYSGVVFVYDAILRKFYRRPTLIR